MARRQENSKYTLYLLIFLVAIILVIGLLSVGNNVDTQPTTVKTEQAATRTVNTDAAVATVSFVVLPPPERGGE